LPEFEAALRSLSEGDITEQPILSRPGWHIIRLDAVAEGRVLPFEAVAPRLSEAIEKRNWTRAARAFAEGLMAEADIAGADFTVI
jgi:peptidyl-prolyl cis-trans isomerase C